MQEEAENLQSEIIPVEGFTEYPIQPSKEELPTSTFPSSPDWIYPKDFDINANVEEMDDRLINKYHDLTHIYFEKILNGAELNFFFGELVILHHKIVKELEKRDLIHFQPINILDSIHLSNRDYQDYIANLNKEVEGVKKKEVNLSFSSPTIV